MIASRSEDKPRTVMEKSLRNSSTKLFIITSDHGIFGRVICVTTFGLSYLRRACGLRCIMVVAVEQHNDRSPLGQALSVEKLDQASEVCWLSLSRN